MSSEPARRGVCLVVSAPSGAGKTTLARRLLAADSGIANSVSVTTRAPRPGEIEGEHYLFRDRATFDAMAASGALLEWAEVFGRRYGTPRAPVQAALAAGRDVLFDIDWQGHRQLRAALPGDVVSVFLLPPSLPELARRLAGRDTDARAVALRMATARDEIGHWDEFDHVLVNRDLDTAHADLAAILRASRLARTRQPGLGELVAGILGAPDPIPDRVAESRG